MGIATPKIDLAYWTDFQPTSEDIEFIYTHMLEGETPLSIRELVELIVHERIRKIKQDYLSARSSLGTIYQPHLSFSVDEKIVLPQLNWQQATVKSIRIGHNPEAGPFSVIEVALADGSNRSFAADLEQHVLNEPISMDQEDPGLDEEGVIQKVGGHLEEVLTEHLQKQDDIVQISQRWFPRALLTDISDGHLNLVEAILDMAAGGPLPAATLIEQLELPAGDHPVLAQFSLNYAMQSDERFDDVGPTGQTIWFLHKYEPESVRIQPKNLRYAQPENRQFQAESLLAQFEGTVVDEYEPAKPLPAGTDEVSFPLIYPHIRSGTIPLGAQLNGFFPTALRSPRVQFTLIDQAGNQTLSCWVVREHNYVFGLSEWYQKNDIMPGSIITIQKGENPNEVFIQANRKRPSREWVRTVMVGVDGGIVFAMSQQNCSTTLNDRMSISILDPSALENVWDHNNRYKGPLANSTKLIMRELAKLSPQGHIHAQELYAAVNIVRRCPPTPILEILVTSGWAEHLGDLYFRLKDSGED